MLILINNFQFLTRNEKIKKKCSEMLSVSKIQQLWKFCKQIEVLLDFEMEIVMKIWHFYTQIRGFRVEISGNTDFMSIAL